MNFTREQVESITQRVIQQLRQNGIAVGGSKSRTDRTRSPQTAQPIPQSIAAANAAIIIRADIVTEDVLLAANVAGKVIAVASSTIITPSGRDFIRRNRITVSTGSLMGQAPMSGIAIVSADSVTLQAALKSSGWSVVKATTDFHAATEAARDANSMLLCSVQLPSAAACLLNRSSVFRAAVIHPSDDLASLTTHMAPNVICLNPKGWSIAGLMSLLKEVSTKPSQPLRWKEVHDTSAGGVS